MKPKYSFGDMVWYMKDNHPTSGFIIGVFEIKQTDTCGKTHIGYVYAFNKGETAPTEADIWVNEKEIFATREELRDSLFG